jgi:hypothetical protein
MIFLKDFSDSCNESKYYPYFCKKINKKIQPNGKDLDSAGRHDGE